MGAGMTVDLRTPSSPSELNCVAASSAAAIRRLRRIVLRSSPRRCRLMLSCLGEPGESVEHPVRCSMMSCRSLMSAPVAATALSLTPTDGAPVADSPLA